MKIPPRHLHRRQATDRTSGYGVCRSTVRADPAPAQDFSEGVKFMKQITKTPTGIQGNLNVMFHACSLGPEPPGCVRACDRLRWTVCDRHCRRLWAACCATSVSFIWTRPTGSTNSSSRVRCQSSLPKNPETFGVRVSNRVIDEVLIPRSRVRTRGIQRVAYGWRRDDQGGGCQDATGEGLEGHSPCFGCHHQVSAGY